jgi:hypothetical protein
MHSFLIRICQSCAYSLVMVVHLKLFLVRSSFQPVPSQKMAEENRIIRVKFNFKTWASCFRKNYFYGYPEGASYGLYQHKCLKTVT